MSRKFHSYEDVCHHFNYKDNLLISPIGSAFLDCMSRKASISDFCVAKESKGLLRGRNDKISKQVICEYADTLRVKVECVGRDVNLCKSAKDSCLKLNKVFAVGLDLIDSQINEKILTCTFLNNSKKDFSLESLKSL